ncbi:MlaD family protein [Haloechinothrix halophila]|uniref:MlaD family protein n=1 Tax=Haloechinothrix halophila TaxID=1069073 RepID=UPI000557F454|nr:MCE family protein [Haloechinothrix halophila]
MAARVWLVIGVMLGVAGLGGLYTLASDDDYRVQFVVPSAAQLVEGSFVWIDGQEAGSVSRLEARDGKAIVTATIDEAYAPIREGAVTRVEWQSVLGERILSIEPGPAEAKPIPSGAMYTAKSSQIEVDQVLATLDDKTRNRLNSLIRRFAKTVDGKEKDLRKTLASAGPAVRAMGSVLEAVGRDGPAIRELVTELEQLTSAVAERQTDLSNVVQDFNKVAGTMAEKQQQLKEGLAELPATLKEAKGTLDEVPETVDEASPLLDDMDPATRRLASTSRMLRPVLARLRPTVAQLRPTLESAAGLLGKTPALLDRTHDVVPQVTRIMEKVHPAVSYLRPYTPEAVGWVNNWGRDYAHYDAEGHVWLGGLAQVGPAAFNAQPSGGLPPLSTHQPKPGEVVDQPWTDAHGSGMR